MQDECESGADAGRRRVRMTRGTGQSLVLSSLCGGCHVSELEDIEIRVSRIGAGGEATLEVLVPDSMFVERKETLDEVRALFA